MFTKQKWWCRDIERMSFHHYLYVYNIHLCENFLTIHKREKKSTVCVCVYGMKQQKCLTNKIWNIYYIEHRPLQMTHIWDIFEHPYYLVFSHSNVPNIIFTLALSFHITSFTMHAYFHLIFLFVWLYFCPSNLIPAIESCIRFFNFNWPYTNFFCHSRVSMYVQISPKWSWNITVKTWKAKKKKLKEN